MTVGALAGKTVLVTGASRGIGRAIARELARQGALVAAHYGAQKDAAEQLVDEITADGGKAFAVGADLSDVVATDGLAEAVLSEISQQGDGKLDILVNNAGIGGGGGLKTIDPAMFDRLFAINVRAPLFLTQKLVPHIRDGGRIINLSSMVSLAAYPGSLAYAMTKASVNSFTRSLAEELGPRGIAVNAVAPGATQTDFIKLLLERPDLAKFYSDAAAMKRLGTVEDIAGVVAFLASDAGAWVTGQVIQASGGMHL